MPLLKPALASIARNLAVSVRSVARRRLTDRTARGKQALMNALSEVRLHVTAAERLGGTVSRFTPIRIEFSGVRDDRPVRITWIDGSRQRVVWHALDQRAPQSRETKGRPVDWLSVLGRDLGLPTAARSVA